MSGVHEPPALLDGLASDRLRHVNVYANGEKVRLDVEAEEGDQVTFRGSSGFRIRLATSLSIGEASLLVAALEQAIHQAGQP